MTDEPSEIARDQFYIARAETLNSYALMEKGLAILFAQCLDTNPAWATLIISKIVNTRARNEVVQRIVNSRTIDKYKTFTNSLFKLIGATDGERNKLVHWHVKEQGDGICILVPSDMFSASGENMDEGEIDALGSKCIFLAAILSEFAGHVKEMSNPALHERYQQPLVYPPEPDDLIGRWHIGNRGQPPASPQ